MVDLAALTYEDLKEAGAEWLKRIDAAEEREKRWRDDAMRAEKIFACDDSREGVPGDVPDFNILHSNVATIVPALYNDTPKPDIRSRFQEPPQQGGQPSVAKQASEALESIIATMIDDGALDKEMEMVAQDAFISGRGVIRVRFDFTQEGTDEAPLVTEERLNYEAVNWDDYREGAATRWADVPWVAFRHSISEEALEEMEAKTPEIADMLAVGRGPNDRKANADKGDVFVWEIWDKANKRVCFVPAGSGEVIHTIDDPLKLKGFFPIAEPIQPITVTGRRRPTCPYRVYQPLAQDLETINNRIAVLVKQLRVRGGAIGAAAEISDIAKAGDGELVAIHNAEQLVAMGGLDRAISWWPLEPTILAIRELVQQREIIKQQIYEITGISDILRGQGAASETATAQSIKSQWGTLRVEALQTQISRCVRDVFILSAELIARHFSTEAMVRASGMEIVPEVEQIIRAPLMHYRIDVESDSTRKTDLATEQMQAQQFLQGTASYFQVMTPIAQQNPAMIAPAVELYAAFARRFKLGRQAEMALEKLIAIGQQPQQPQGPTPEQQKAEAEAQMDQARLQFDYEKLSAEVELKRAELGLKEAELGLKGVKTLGDMEAEDMDRDERERGMMSEYDA